MFGRRDLKLELQGQMEGLAGYLREVRGELANLQQEVASLRGQVRTADNSAAAANNRCERLEPRVARLEQNLLLPSAVERTLAPGDEDAVSLPQKRRCPQCHGDRVVDADPMGYTDATCDTCDGYGYLDIVP